MANTYTFALRLWGAAVHLKDVIRAPKDNIKVGQWRSGKVPKADFLSRGAPTDSVVHSKWTVIQFQAQGVECRVLVVVNHGKQNYEAILGVVGRTERSGCYARMSTTPRSRVGTATQHMMMRRNCREV